MTQAASYVLSAYSFIFDIHQDKIPDIGYKEKGENPIPSFDESILIELCSEVRSIFSKEDNVLEIEGDVNVVGDIHGSLHDLIRILRYNAESNSKILFLGDYIDRGNFSVECITLLFALKVMKPDSVFLIRGNHEFDSICRQYGFKNQLLNINPNCSNDHTNKKVKDTNASKSSDQIYENYCNYYINRNCYQYAEALYHEFMKSFSYLPICAIVNNTTFCIHGGLSPNLNKIDNIKTKITRPINNFNESELLCDLLWSDPSTTRTSFLENQRGYGYFFNLYAVNMFLSKNSLKRMIRSHQCVKNGIQHHFGHLCFTVFSASLYDKGCPNLSGVITLFKNEDKMYFNRFPPINRFQKEETAYYKVEPLNKTNEPIKCNYFSMRHPIIVFKGNTLRSNPNINHNKSLISTSKSVRDSHGLKINCHVNPASIAHYKKQVYPVICVPEMQESSLSNNETENAIAQQKSIRKSWSMLS